jgi:hypothetical protein
VHLRELIIIDQGFKVNPSSFFIAVVLDLSRDIEEGEIKFRESLIFESHLQFSLLVDLKTFFQRFT